MTIIYTDGSCEPNPGPGGWAAIIVPESGGEIELSGHEARTTNNRMELLGPLRALEYCILRGIERVQVVSDSRYVVNSMTQWARAWALRGWIKPHANRDLIMELFRIQTSVMRVGWKWVRGHSGHKYNERCDKLANEARINGTLR